MERPRQHLRAADGVVLAREVDAFLAEQTLQQHDRFLEPAHAHPGRVIGNAELAVIERAPPGADADLDATAGKEIERRDLLREHHRVPVVIREHEAADAQARRRIGRGHERWYWCE